MGSGPVALAADHGGYKLKESLKAWLRARNVPVLDLGTHSTDAVDYPVFAKKAGVAVASGEAWRAVIIDGAGIGSCMAANKIPGVRAGMAFDVKTANNAREHNNANVLTLGAGYLSEADAKAIVDVFLSTECKVDRHLRRAAMIDELDAGRPKPRRSQGMGDYEQLVQQITKVLSANPALLASLGGGPHTHGGAPGFVCTTCNTCNGHCCSSAPETVRALNKSAPGSRLSAGLGVKRVPADVAALIDHTLLKADATYDQIDQLCDEAREFGFASVCVNPMHVRRCAQRLKGASAKVCTVIGFPLGATPREIKAMEARRALRDGARELDMVIAIGALKSGDHQTVLDDIRLIAEVAHEGGAILKVIIETALLTDDEKTTACVLSKRARADFVKTSTGFSKSGATAHDVALMARAVDHRLGVKASGGVKNMGDAQKMVLAGATRIGASVGVKIAKEARGEKVAASSGGGY
jgi:deoxyribose-phosphate aldolase